MKIVWDERKRAANLEKHGFDFAELTVDYFADAVILPARAPRFKAVNRIDDTVMTVVFSPLGAEAIAIVSFRPAGRVERRAIG